MLLIPVSELDLAHLIDSAHKTVFVQSAATSAAPVLDSLVRAKKRGVDVKVLLGAKPALNIVFSKVLMGNRPYELTAGKELAAVSAANIPVLINPRFNELAGDQIQEGVESHASYLSIDGATAVACTGAWSAAAFKTQTNTCIALPDGEDAAALGALFLSEFNERWAADQRSKYEAAARARFVVSPGAIDQLVGAGQQANTVDVIASGLGHSPLMDAIAAKGAPARVVLPQTYRGEDRGIETLVARGLRIRYSPAVVDGLVMILKQSAGEGPIAFVGSQRLTNNSMQKPREVGTLVSGEVALSRHNVCLRRFGETRRTRSR